MNNELASDDQSSALLTIELRFQIPLFTFTASRTALSLATESFWRV